MTPLVYLMTMPSCGFLATKMVSFLLGPISPIGPLDRGGGDKMAAGKMVNL
jgi:hypothetical protein